MVEKILSRSVRLMFTGGLVLGAQLAGAQEATQKVEITGSRIPTINVEGPSPITVLGAKDIKADGVRNVESLLNNLPQVFADQTGNVSNGSTGTATVSLRGLGADRTLVLVNGRRLPFGSPANSAADINQIPAQLIKRVEVSTGGGSAVYGSDAIAGVVNFILNDKFEGVQIDANHSFFNHQQNGTAGVAELVRARAALNPSEFAVPGDKGRDGNSLDASLLIGSNFANGKGNATVYFGYKRDNALLQSERDFSACSISSTAAGFACGGSNTNATGSFSSLNGSFRPQTAADAAGTARARAATDQYNFGPLNYFQRPSERYNVNAFAKYDLFENVKLYSEFSFHDDRTTGQVAPGGVFGNIATLRGDNPLLSQSFRTAFGLNSPTDTTDVIVQRRNVEGGGRASEFRNTSFREVFGVKGDIGNWTYDVFLQASKVIYSQSEQNYFLDSRINRALDIVNVGGVATCRSVVDGSDPACVPYNPYRIGGVTAAQLAYLQVPGSRQGSTEQLIQGASVGSDLGNYGIKLPTANSGVGVSFGVEHRVDKLTLQTDAATASGELSGSGGPTPSLSGRTRVSEAFGEVNIPLIEGKAFADFLNVKGQYRYSDYSSGATTDTYGVGVEWAPIKEVRFRGSYQRAVRAPNVVDLFQAQGNNLFDADEDPCAGTTPTASAAACARTGVTAAQYGRIQDSAAGQYNTLQGGNPNLKPESSDSYTFGVILQPVKNLTVSIDYFDIKIKDTIGTIAATTILDQCLATGNPQFCSLVQRDRTGSLWLLPEGRVVSTNINIGSTKTSGIDVNASYVQKIANYGALNFNIVGTWLDKLIVEEVPGLGSFDCAGLYGNSKCGQSNPTWRHKARLTWNSPWAFDVSASWRYFNSVDLERTSSNPLLAGNVNAVDRTLKTQNYFDIAGVWNVTKSLAISGGVNNVFDRDPPITSQLPVGSGNGNTFPGFYDALGRKIFINGTYKF